MFTKIIIHLKKSTLWQAVSDCYPSFLLLSFFLGITGLLGACHSSAAEHWDPVTSALMTSTWCNAFSCRDLLCSGMSAIGLQTHQAQQIKTKEDFTDEEIGVSGKNMFWRDMRRMNHSCSSYSNDEIQLLTAMKKPKLQNKRSLRMTYWHASHFKCCGNN